ncbi:MAG: hypothetical protein V1875_07305 [Candidatus Altiarchaeota archaeon]
MIKEKASSYMRFLGIRKEMLIFYYLASLLFSLSFLVVDQPRVNDEDAYVLMADSVAKTGNVLIENGLDEYDAPELMLHSTKPVVVDGRRTLVGIPPPLYPYLVYAPYVMFGVRGLVWVNLLSFILSTYLIYAVCRRFLDDINVSLASAVVFSLLTFSIKYSLDIWPHSLSVLLTLLPVALVLGGGASAAACAGFVCALAVGVRYTGVFSVALLFTYLFFSRRRGHAALFVAGSSPPLLLIFLINQAAYGSAAMTGHGDLWGFIQPLLILALAAGALYVIIKARHAGIGLAKMRRNSLALAALAVLVFLVLGPYIKILYSYLFDFSYNRRYAELPNKMALLQSTPLLVMSAVGAFMLLERRVKPGMVLLFCSLILVPLAFYVATDREGGLKHMRYLLESMPYLSIFSAYAYFSFWPDISGQLRNYFIAYYSFIVFMSLQAVNLIAPASVTYVTLKVPTLLAMGALVAYYRREKYANALAVLMVSFVFFSVISNGETVAEDVLHKQYFAGESERFRELLPDGSVVLYTGYLDTVSVTNLKVEKDLALAYTGFGNLTTNKRLIGHFLPNRPVFLLTGVGSNETRADALFSEFAATELDTGMDEVRIFRFNGS